MKRINFNKMLIIAVLFAAFTQLTSCASAGLFAQTGWSWSSYSNGFSEALYIDGIWGDWSKQTDSKLKFSIQNNSYVITRHRISEHPSKFDVQVIVPFQEPVKDGYWRKYNCTVIGSRGGEHVGILKISGKYLNTSVINVFSDGFGFGFAFQPL